jgi:hypothetical protein
MPAQVTLKALGIVSSPNQLALPEGAMSIASNIVLRRDAIVEQRRGFKLYGTQVASAVKQLFTYKNRILRHFGSTLQFDSEVLNATNESIFNSFSGSFSETETGLRIKSIESNGNFYFTTSSGIKKISAANADELSTASGYVTNAGGIKAINGSARIDLELGNSTGFLPEDSAVAYRFLWAINDANNNLVSGTPSERVILYNSLINFLIPDFDRVLGALDDITTTSTTAFIGDGNYISTLKLESTASSTDLKSQIIALAEKIDTDILYANNGGTAPIDLASVTIASGVATITASTGDFTQYLSTGSKVFLSDYAGLATGLNGSQTVVDVTALTFTFNTTVGDAVVANTGTEQISSYEYRNAIANISYQNTTFDLNTTTINNPATNNQLKILQGAISGIITQLQDEPTTVISSGNQTTYIIPLDVTTTTNVILNVNIPEEVTSNYFLQVYRSDIAQALGTTILGDLTPNDEMQLVYEAFPTTAELSAKTMQILDEVSDEFAGANLYTNPSTGEGILQANDVPPLSKDINRFKNVLFYANTQTRQRLNLNLLGVTNFKAGNITDVTAANPSVITTDSDHNLSTDDLIYVNGTGVAAIDGKVWKVTVLSATTFSIPVLGTVSTVGYWTNSMVAFIDSSSARQYYFIKEMAEVTNVATIADVADSLNGDYFTINSGQDQTLYYVWYKTSGGAVSDPAPAGLTGIRVNVNTGATADDVALATRNVLSRYPQDFSISGATNNVIVTNVTKGVTTDATTATSGFTITITQQGRGENASNNEVLLSTLVSPAQAVDASARSLQNILNKNSSENTYIYYLSGLSDAPGKLLVEGRSLADGQFYILANNSFVGDSFDPPISPTHFISGNTVASPTVVTTTAAHGLVSNNQAVIAFSNSTPLINGINTITNLTGTTFSIPVAVTIAGTSGVLIDSEDAVFSDNETKINRVYYSKLNQPEAVPLVNYFDIGSQENPVSRIFPLRDSLFVFKENEGLYRISGETAPFNLALFDSTTSLIAPDSVSALNNQIFCWTDGGIQAVSEAGVDNMSRDIDNIILKIGSSAYPNFRQVTWGIGYDSDQAYIVYTNNLPTDTVATIGYRYNLETGRWTSIDKSTTCGILNNEDDKLYLGAGDLNYIEQERKNFDRTDFADREWVKTIASNSFFDGGERIKLSSVSNVAIGDVLVQEQYVTVYNFNSLLMKLDLDANIGAVPIVSITTGSSPTITVKNKTFAPADVDTGTETITIASHGFVNGQKVRFVSSGTLPGGLTANDNVFIINTTVNTFQISQSFGGAAINLTTAGTGTHTVFRFHNLSAGDYVTLSGTDCDPNLDGTHQVVSALTGYTFTITPSSPITTAGTTGTARYNYSESQEMVGGDDIRTKIIALANKLDTDPGTSFEDYFDIIDSKSGSITANTAANPTVITSASHELENGRYITISGTNSTPTFDGNYVVTFVNANSFSVPVSIEIAGSAGSWATLTSDYRDLQACYNAIIDQLNLDPGVVFNNYQQVSSITAIESLVTAVNAFTNEVSLAPGINFLVGSVTAYNAIESIIQYTPQTMEDPLGWKHMTNFTMMFENKAFTEGVISFASDLLPEFIDVPFEGDGNGIFGYQNFGSNFFGGGSHGAPFRTYFPRQVMRCRYFLIKFTHKVARESYAIFGITADGNISQSNRAYRR